jgi:transcriptional regulator with XRE-family HTH domain
MKKRARIKRQPFPLKQVLAKLCSSQNKLAAASGIPLPTINALANGGNPTWSTILYLANCINAKLGDFDPSELPATPRRRRKVS